MFLAYQVGVWSICRSTSGEVKNRLVRWQKGIVGPPHHVYREATYYEPLATRNFGAGEKERLPKNKTGVLYHVPVTNVRSGAKVSTTGSRKRLPVSAGSPGRRPQRPVRNLYRFESLRRGRTTREPARTT